MILFRTDSSYKIGTGHVIRCLHLASILNKIGFETGFVCLKDAGNINQKITLAGHKLFEVSNEAEALQTINSLKAPWLVVDHYNLDETWEKQIKSTKIFVIDDLGNRSHQCQVLLDQNYRKDYSIYNNKVPEDCHTLLGPGYCLLDNELAKAGSAKVINQPPRIVCFFGGVDSSGELVKLAQNIKLNPNFNYDLVCLSSHMHLTELKKLNLPLNCKLHIDTPDWRKLLSSSDFYIGSGGTVTWERLFLGVPGAVITVADNQVIPTQDLADNKYQFYWGPNHSFDYKQVDTKLTHIFNDRKSLAEMSERGKTLVNKFDTALAKSIFT